MDEVSLRFSASLFSNTSSVHVGGEVQECFLLADTFGYVMQGLLFFLTMGTLLLKWKLEVPQRPFKIFALDISKQCMGAGWYHVLNMVSSMVMMHAKANYHADECAWYWVQFMFDDTLGLYFNYTVLRLTERFFGYESGMYCDGDSPSLEGLAVTVDFTEWLKQGLFWCLVISISKFCVLTALFCDGVASDIGIYGTTWIEDPETRLFFVMVVTPAIMNTMAFWVTDEFLKFDDSPKAIDSTDTGAKPRLSKAEDHGTFSQP